MIDLTTLGLFAQYFLGLYFIGSSIGVTFGKNAENRRAINRSIDWFKLIFGIALFVAAIFGKVA